MAVRIGRSEHSGVSEWAAGLLRLRSIILPMVLAMVADQLEPGTAHDDAQFAI